MTVQNSAHVDQVLLPGWLIQVVLRIEIGDGLGRGWLVFVPRSPGVTCISVNVISDTNSSTGTSQSMQRMMNRATRP